MAYYVMLGEILLPITPSAMNVKTPSMNKTVNLINEGEINIPKDQGLREISFEFLIPTVQKYPFANWQLGSYTATALIPLLNIRKRNALPLYLNIVRMSPAGKFLYFTRIYCLIEDFEYKEDAEEYGLDTMCSINLKEYKPYATKRVKLKEATNAKPGTKQAKVTNTRDSSSHVKKSTVTTQKNETVVSAAKRNGDDLVDLSKANNIKTCSIENLDNVSTKINIDNVDFSKWDEPATAVSDGRGGMTIIPSKTIEVKSFGDTVLLGDAAKNFKSPSPPSKTLFDLIGEAVSPGAIPY